MSPEILNVDQNIYSNVEVILAYDSDGIPFLLSDTDAVPRTLGGFSCFLEPKDVHKHFEQKDIEIPSQISIAMKEDHVLINQKSFPIPPDLDALTLLIFEESYVSQAPA